MKLLFLYIAVCLASLSNVASTTISTRLAGNADNLAFALESYAKRNNGQLPAKLQDLAPYLNIEAISSDFGGIDASIIFFPTIRPKLGDTNGSEIVALTAFPIIEDRRQEPGRYIVYRQSDGRFFSRWESEQSIKKSAEKANIYLRPASNYEEKPLVPLYPEYGQNLFQDALSQGISAEKAAAVIEKHIEDASQRRAPIAKTWAEVVANQPKSTPPITNIQNIPRSSASTQANAPSTTFPETTKMDDAKSSFALSIILLAVVAALLVGTVVFFFSRKSS